MSKTLEELRRSSYHQQLGRKMCAAFLAQQQGITLSTAFKKTPGPVGDLWLMIADLAEWEVGKAMDALIPNDANQKSSGPIM
jgi:hypothetical protein